MKNKIIIFFIIFATISCNNSKKKKPVSQVNQTPKEVFDRYPNCFTNDEIKKIKQHFESLEKVIKLGKKFSFSNSPISYTTREKEWLKKTLSRSICKGSLNIPSESCPKNITYNIDCSEVIIFDGEEHFSEQDYWYILTKQDGKITISDSGGAG